MKALYQFSHLWFLDPLSKNQTLAHAQKCDCVPLTFNKWRVKTFKNINKKTSTWCVKLIRKQEIILFWLIFLGNFILSLLFAWPHWKPPRVVGSLDKYYYYYYYHYYFFTTWQILGSRNIHTPPRKWFFLWPPIPSELFKIGSQNGFPAPLLKFCFCRTPPGNIPSGNQK